MPFGHKRQHHNEDFVELNEIPRSNTIEWNALKTFAPPGLTIPPGPVRSTPPLPPRPLTAEDKDVTVLVDFASGPGPALRHVPRAPPPASAYGSQSSSPTLVDNNRASFMTMSTIDGMIDVSGAPTHPCTITPTLQTTVIPLPAATYYPTNQRIQNRFPQLPERPQPRSIMDRWLRRELRELETQHERDVEAATAYKTNRLRIHFILVAFFITAMIVFIVLGGVYGNQTGVHNALVGSSIICLAFALIGTVSVVIELGNKKNSGRNL